MIRPALTADAAAIAAIYNYYVVNTIVTFEEDPVSEKEMASRLAEVRDAKMPWLVSVEGDRVLGYAYANKWKSRCAYRFALESTIYLDQAAVGQGRGKALYSALIAEVKALKMHAMIGGVALPNAASVALHEKLGFQKTAHFREVGFKFDQWIDVGYWELLL